MRIGLIADIHGNLSALDTVLDRLQQDGVEQIVCLGDIAALGPQPSDVIARLRDIKCPCVLGNTDAWLFPDPPLTAEPATTVAVTELTRWCAEQLTDTDLAFLRAIPLTLTLNLRDGTSLLAFHASPRSLDDVITATTPSEEVHSMLGNHNAGIYTGGHTHIPLLRRLGQLHILNPGSIGLPGVGPGGPDLPVNTDVSWAEYIVLDDSETGLSISFRRIALDLERMLAVAARSGMPHLEWWKGRWA